MRKRYRKSSAQLLVLALGLAAVSTEQAEAGSTQTQLGELSCAGKTWVKGTPRTGILQLFDKDGKSVGTVKTDETLDVVDMTENGLIVVAVPANKDGWTPASEDKTCALTDSFSLVVAADCSETQIEYTRTDPHMTAGESGSGLTLRSCHPTE